MRDLNRSKNETWRTYQGQKNKQHMNDGKINNNTDDK